MRLELSSTQRGRLPYANRRGSADLAATRIENARLRREIARFRTERGALTRFIAAADTPGEREERLRATVDAARHAFHAHGAALYLYAPDQGRTTDAIFSGYGDDAVAWQIALGQAPRSLPSEQALLATGQPLSMTIAPRMAARLYPGRSGDEWHALTLPLQCADRIIGCLQLSRAATAPAFAAADLLFGRDLAASASLIIGRIEQEAAIERRSIQAEALREIGRQLSAELDFERFLDNAATHLMALVDVRDCLLLTWDEEAQELTPALYIGDGQRRLWSVKIRPDEQRGLTSIVIRERRTLHVADYLEECRRHAIEPVIPEGEWERLAWVGVPLLARGRLIGALVMERRDHAFNLEEFASLESLAGQLATAMENARLYAEVRQLATSDPLTGLANHRHLHERLEQELERTIRHERPLAVAMLDLDRFKQYNDTHGHQVGDELLRSIAQALRAEARAGGSPRALWRRRIPAHPAGDDRRASRSAARADTGAFGGSPYPPIPPAARR